MCKASDYSARTVAPPYNRAVKNDSIAGRLRTFFEAEPHDAAVVYLFGSVARGDATESSDVDVAVLYTSDPPLSYDGLPLTLEGELERLLGRTTQLVTMNHAPVDLRVRVLRDGVLVLDRDPPARIRFEVRTRNEWFDLEPVLREYRGTGAASEPAR